jgi:hypothetical protein
MSSGWRDIVDLKGFKELSGVCDLMGVGTATGQLFERGEDEALVVGTHAHGVDVFDVLRSTSEHLHCDEVESACGEDPELTMLRDELLASGPACRKRVDPHLDVAVEPAVGESKLRSDLLGRSFDRQHGFRRERDHDIAIRRGAASRQDSRQHASRASDQEDVDVRVVLQHRPETGQCVFNDGGVESVRHERLLSVKSYSDSRQGQLPRPKTRLAGETRS